MKPRLQICKTCPHFKEGHENNIYVYVCFLERSDGQLLAEINTRILGDGRYEHIPDACPYTLEHSILPWNLA